MTRTKRTGAIAGFVHTAGSDKTSTTELKITWTDVTGAPCPSDTKCVILKPGHSYSCNENDGIGPWDFACLNCEGNFDACENEELQEDLTSLEYDNYLVPGTTEPFDECDPKVLLSCVSCSGPGECPDKS